MAATTTAKKTVKKAVKKSAAKARKAPAKKKSAAKKAKTQKYVYSWGDGKADGNSTMKNLLGGKGANLAEMSRIGDRKSTRLNSSHIPLSRMPSSA